MRERGGEQTNKNVVSFNRFKGESLKERKRERVWKKKKRVPLNVFFDGSLEKRKEIVSQSVTSG
jgi:hypothetical protein